MSPHVENNAKTSKKPGGVTGKGFMPGKSGNPGGRPKNTPVTDLLGEFFENATDREMIKQQLKNVFKGKSMVAKVMLMDSAADRLEGRVVQPVKGELEVTLTLSERLLRAKERIDGK